jgi:hypothetical protein
MSRISTTVTSTVYPGQGGIGDQVLITSSGTLAPSAYRVVGLVSDVAGAVIVNDGFIRAGYGGYYYGSVYPRTLPGGDGVDLTAPATLHNAGTIAGGDAGFVTFGMIFFGNYLIGAGGDGVHSTSALALSNSGAIDAGVGVTVGYGNAGAGGVGVDIGAGSSVVNSGKITGGGGGYQDTEYPPRALAAEGGAGVELGAGSVLRNTGSIEGGYGGRAFGPAGAGGAGVAGVDLTVVNLGRVSGGHGGPSYAYSGGAGGAGIYVRAGGVVTNHGTITGGIGGQAGFSGVGAGGAGGIGVDLQQGGSLNNFGSISGGYGGQQDGFSAAGTGGIGVELTPGSVSGNHGTITGGAGSGNGQGYPGGNGGAGVVLDGGTLTNWGTISGGAGGYSPTQPGLMGDAVIFGSGVATLVVKPGAVFNGAVQGNAAVNDTLALSGPGSGTLSGLGSQFTSFTTVSETAGATWTLLGPSTLGQHASLDVGGFLRVLGDDSGAGLLAAGSVVLDGGGALLAAQIDAGSIVFAGGGRESLAVGSASDVGGTIAGFGAGDTIDLTQLIFDHCSFAGGTLSLLSGGELVGTLSLAGDYDTANFKAVALTTGGTGIEFVSAGGEAVAMSPRDFGLRDVDGFSAGGLCGAEPGWHAAPDGGLDFAFPAWFGGGMGHGFG